jgi:hypothetical protein
VFDTVSPFHSSLVFASKARRPLHDQGILKGDCTIDLLFGQFGISCVTSDNFSFYLQSRLIQTSQTGGQWYSDTSPFSVPWHDLTPIGGSQTCPPNIRLGWKWLILANTLAYYDKARITVIKSFIVQAPGNTNWRRRFNTVDFLIKAGCFMIKYKCFSWTKEVRSWRSIVLCRPLQ